MRAFLFAVSILCVLGAASPGMARVTHAHTEATRPPPEPRDEILPGERPGHAWTAGYWNWNGSRYVWQPGDWVALREGYDWVPASWEQRGENWKLNPGHWEANEDYVDASESPEVIAAQAQVEAAANAHKTAYKKTLARKPVPRARKKIDYSDRTQWPRYIKH
ncbi:MAG: YXWGXW repeat-containing protein [Rickettsiales bacterium]